MPSDQALIPRTLHVTKAEIGNRLVSRCMATQMDWTATALPAGWRGEDEFMDEDMPTMAIIFLWHDYAKWP